MTRGGSATPSRTRAWRGRSPERCSGSTPGGPVKRSGDGGATWEEVGSTGGEPRALFAVSPDQLYAVLLDGTVKQSTDGGATWSDRVTPPASE